MLKTKTLKIVIALFISLFSLTGGALQAKQSENEVEFGYSKDELKAMEKWKKKSFDELLNDALVGDPAALHMIGEAGLYGLCGLPINVERANQYFEVAAALGFAPAIDKIRSMYTEDNPNPFLALVYVNLTASSGHTEYTMNYHKMRSYLLEKYGNKMCEEIERIASIKKIKIFETMDKLEKSKDKKEFIFSLFASRGITEGDNDLGMDYWEKFFIKTKH